MEIAGPEVADNAGSRSSCNCCNTSHFVIPRRARHFYVKNRSAYRYLLDTFPDGEPVPTSPGSVLASPGDPSSLSKPNHNCGLPGRAADLSSACRVMTQLLGMTYLDVGIRGSRTHRSFSCPCPALGQRERKPQRESGDNMREIPVRAGRATGMSGEGERVAGNHKHWIYPMRPSIFAPICAWRFTFGRSHNLAGDCRHYLGSARAARGKGHGKSLGGNRIGTVCRTWLGFCCARESSVLRNRAACRRGRRSLRHVRQKLNKFNILTATGCSPPSSNQRQHFRGR